MKNSNVAARTVRSRKASTTEEPTINELKLARAKPHTNWGNIADQIAQCGWWYNGHCVEALKAHFKHPHEYHVDRYYPNATGGPLYADFPTHKSDVETSMAKQEYMKSIGLRMVVVESDTKLDQALIQLGEL